MIRGMLLRIVRNAVAKQYSFQGKGESNKKFDKYLIVSMMLNVVRSHEEYKSFSESSFQTIVADWLRNSDKRLRTELKREAASIQPVADYL
ncbi:unnamed protein product [Bemisia tabaci]|uniref:Uncharacterized protein n=1 Tax=Bemisia tabaci TaxID=7038 RepID=A0A9P0A2B9_BEMTA|nr:unnamed protein product [Bemisia tabaci]